MKTKDITLTALFAATLCIIAPISIPIGIVPITLATFGVYLISALFSFKRSLIIIALYILIGGIGMPVFSNGQAGFAVLAGPTGGYIFGYLLCALVQPIIIKLLKDKPWSYPIGMLVGTLLIYVFGTAWFLIYMNMIKAVPYSFAKAMTVCVTPFLLGDTVKIVLASLIAIRYKERLLRIIK